MCLCFFLLFRSLSFSLCLCFLALRSLERERERLRLRPLRLRLRLRAGDGERDALRAGALGTGDAGWRDESTRGGDEVVDGVMADDGADGGAGVGTEAETTVLAGAEEGADGVGAGGGGGGGGGGGAAARGGGGGGTRLTASSADGAAPDEA